MIAQVLKATCDNSVKNDFVFTCKKYLETLKLNLSFDEIEKMSKYTFKKLLKEKTRSAAFEYLEAQKNTGCLKKLGPLCFSQFLSFYSTWE